MTAAGQGDARPAATASREIAWHALEPGEAVAALRSDAARGLSAAEAAARLASAGPNALPEAKQTPALVVFLRQFKSPLIYLLMVAAAVAAALGELTDAIVICCAIVLNAIVGAVQEGRAQRSMLALRRLTLPTARVRRDGAEQTIASRDVVPGDVLLAAAGETVAADARILEGAALRAEEAALTGESLPAAKDARAVAADALLGDRHGMLHAGTHLIAGRCSALVVATGPATEIGRIDALARAVVEPQTPLEKRVAQFGRYVIVAAVAVVSLVVAVGLLRGLPFVDIFLVAISQLVGIVPEGLPVAMTIALAVGVQRMARRRAIVRRLAAVESLGSTTVICTDKTGTLTRNEMTVAAIVLADGRAFEVSGAGYAPEGRLSLGGRDHAAAGDTALRDLLEAGVLCNDAQLAPPEAGEPQWRPLGDPTEVALLTAARKGGLDPGEVRARFPRRAELPFDAVEKMMATEHGGRGEPFVIVKGAPEVVVALCAGAHEPMLHAARELSARALRVLAIATLPAVSLVPGAGVAALRGRGRLLGIVGQLDPPRDEVEQAVQRCRAAGIRPVMVTGDHESTGLAIARRLGIARPGDAVLDGRALDRLSVEALGQQLDSVSVFARVHPAQKLRIVQAYQQRGDVVAMTGDGVNDAPALARADVGVAMGQSGTDVAKEASKIVVTDDNFATIVAAVEEGRVVYGNIKKAVLLLLSTSAAEVSVLLLALVIGFPPPFTAVQILWNNLVTEALITVNLVMEPPEGDEMKRPPVPAGEPLLTREVLLRLALMTPVIVAVTLGWFVVRRAAGLPEVQVRTETFTLLAICEWFNVLNCRSSTRSALTLGLFRNPWLLGGLALGNGLQVLVVFWPPAQKIFRTVPFEPRVVLALGLAGSVVLWAEEIRKLLARRSRRAAAAR